MPVTRTKSRRIAPKSSEAVVQTCSASLSKLDYMHHANHGNKWMLFPKLEEVTRVWKHVVEGVINDRLSPTAKVAPDEGKPGDRLICIYTKVSHMWTTYLSGKPNMIAGLQGRG